MSTFEHAYTCMIICVHAFTFCNIIVSRSFCIHSTNLDVSYFPLPGAGSFSSVLSGSTECMVLSVCTESHAFLFSG